MQKEKTHFGFEEVNFADKAPKVKGVFRSVADKYDLMNDVMSLGVHRVWKNIFVTQMNIQKKERIIDVAGGTGDIAMKMMSKGAKVTVCDLTQEMIDAGQAKHSGNGGENINWQCGDAMTLPFDDNAFDVYTISFGLRNVTDIQKALDEAYRTLDFGGRFYCLEFNKVAIPLLEKPYDFYSFKILPQMGEWIANDRASYQYLAESIRQMPSQEKLCRMMKQAGFDNVSYRNLFGGIACIHVGWKT